MSKNIKEDYFNGVNCITHAHFGSKIIEPHSLSEDEVFLLELSPTPLNRGRNFAEVFGYTAYDLPGRTDYHLTLMVEGNIAKAYFSHKNGEEFPFYDDLVAFPKRRAKDELMDRLIGCDIAFRTTPKRAAGCNFHRLLEIMFCRATYGFKLPEVRLDGQTYWGVVDKVYIDAIERLVYLEITTRPNDKKHTVCTPFPITKKSPLYVSSHDINGTRCKYHAEFADLLGKQVNFQAISTMLNGECKYVLRYLNIEPDVTERDSNDD